MSNEQQDREETIFLRALELAPGEKRNAYLEEVCAGYANLRQSVAQRLTAHDRPASVLATSADGIAGTSPGGEKSGDRFGSRYELIVEIGRGGMGTVWLAEQSEPVQRKVALKIIKLGMDTREVVARFETERQALSF
jgi:hypothetical protein